MNWLPFLSALGLGAILTKLLDIFWLDRITRENERRKWLRDQRLSAYSELAKDFLSLGFSRGDQFDNAFQAYAVAARAMLLIEDAGLVKKIDDFVVTLNRFNTLQDEKRDAEAEALYRQLWDETRQIVDSLRLSLIQK